MHNLTQILLFIRGALFIPTVGVDSQSKLDSINPRTKEEFDEFSKLLVERIRKHEVCKGISYNENLD